MRPVNASCSEVAPPAEVVKSARVSGAICSPECCLRINPQTSSRCWRVRSYSSLPPPGEICDVRVRKSFSWLMMAFWFSATLLDRVRNWSSQLDQALVIAMISSSGGMHNCSMASISARGGTMVWAARRIPLIAVSIFVFSVDNFVSLIPDSINSSKHPSSSWISSAAGAESRSRCTSFKS